MKSLSIIFGVFGIAIGISNLNFAPSQPKILKETPVQDVLTLLGDEKPSHYKEFSDDQVSMGEELVKTGRTIGPDGKKSRYISKHYVCTSCHNLKIEDPDLRYSNPETRLPFVKEKGIPFLQGSTFRGIVNRESWYNDDYVKKYGDEKIEKAHKNLRESIQLCAVECSQGRPMENWEIEAVLAYYWTLQFDLEDIKASDELIYKLNSRSDSKAENESLIRELKSLYLQKSPAHFYDSPASKFDGYPGLTGDADRGRDIYQLSCLHCHKVGGVSHYVLDDGQLSFLDMKRTMFKNSHFSLYQIIPYGTYAIPGHRPYMPHYPEERMSKQQVEDLRAYIEFRTEHNN